MGNDTSADGKDPKLSLVVTGGGDDAAGRGGEGAGMMSMGRGAGTAFLATTSSPSAGASTATRRIVKGTKPIPNTPTLEEEHHSGCDTDDDDNTDNNHNHKAGSITSSKNTKHTRNKHSKESIPNAIAESPSVAREIEQEKIKMIKKDRKQSAMENQKAKRENVLQQRRKGSGGATTPEPPSTDEQQQQQQASNNKDKTTATATATTAKTKTTVRANPMSRFLSVFSVEPQHPEHKRMYEKSSDDDGTIVEPTEKKRRASDAGTFPFEDDKEDDIDTGASSNANSSKSFMTSKILTASAAVAVAAIVVGIFLRVASLRRK